ncbi:MAG: hypothetical protein HOP03_08940 [Lysobacter sp.]|nr:hypothetical protein [Lysobacter sp.]
MASVLVYVVLLPAQHAASIRSDDEPWIGLPDTGMDASKIGVRWLLRLPYGTLMSENEFDQLKLLCGNGDTFIRERYIAHIGRNAWEPFLDVQIDVQGEWLEIAMRDGSPLPAPSAPPDADDASSQALPLRPIVRMRMQKDDAGPMQQAWRQPALWHAEQNMNAFSCRDGNPVFLEACINNRYAARFRNCDAEAGVPTQQLWQAVNRLLPALGGTRREGAMRAPQ